MRLLGDLCSCFNGSHGQPQASTAGKGDMVCIVDSCLNTHEHRSSVPIKGILDALGPVAVKQAGAAQLKDRSGLKQSGSSIASDSFAITVGVDAGGSSSNNSLSASDAAPDDDYANAQSHLRQLQQASQPDLLALARLWNTHKRKMQTLPNHLLGLQPRTVTSSTEDHTELYPYIHNHGRGIMSLSTVQKGLQHFVVPGVGYIAFSMMEWWPVNDFINVAVALGNPICDPKHYAYMAAAFLEQYPKALFAQISRQFAEILQESGMLINSMGGETVLDLRTYTFSGYAKRGLRSCIAAAVRDGYTVQEVLSHTADSTAGKSAATVKPAAAADTAAGKAAAAAADTAANEKRHPWSAVAAEMQEVDQLWNSVKGRERAARVWFLNRPPVFEPEAGVRKFIARDANGVMQAFIFCDAVYEAGEVVGYYANVTRMRPDAHPGVLNLMIKEIIDKLRSEAKLSEPPKRLSVKKSQRKKQQKQQDDAAADTSPVSDTLPAAPGAAAGSDPISSGGSSSGLRFLSLGLSPFHQRDDSEFKHSKTIAFCLWFMYKHGTGFYPFKSLAAAKAKYGAGLHEGRYEDPNVSYNQVYLAHSFETGFFALGALFDFTVMLGMLIDPWESIGNLVKYKVKRRVKMLKKRSGKTRQQASG